ncbi:LEM domain-containing protein 2 [Hemicordylus capensis]|uniref:LEM domain-containing protein 2 n=1 Tax=Hemicordylus capensis TaxID=884348 RepID=UPI002303C2A6|nr:LEM domain-containing protein 2 [Hemicordylus capensis]
MAAAGLSDAELRAELLALGYQPGPITDSTRKLYAKKLTRLRAEVAAGLRSRDSSRAHPQAPSGSPRPKAVARVSPRGTPRARVLVRRESEDEDGEEEEEGADYEPPRRKAETESRGLAQRNHWGAESGPTPPGRTPWTAGERATPSSNSWWGGSGLASRRTLLETGGGVTSTCRRDEATDRLTSSTHWGAAASPGGSPGLSSSKWWERGQSTTPSTSWESRAGGRGAGFSHRSYLERESGVTPSSYLGSGTRGGEEGLTYRTPWRAEKESELTPRTSKSLWGTGTARGLGHSTRWDGTRQDTGVKSQAQWRGRKGLEFYLSWFLWLATLGLLVVFLGILWVKMMGPARLEGEENFKQLPMDCAEKTDDYCQEKQEEIVITVLYELYNYLAIQAGSFECGNPQNLQNKCIPVHEAREYIENATGKSAEMFGDALQWLLDSHKESGIWLQGDDPLEPVTTVDQVVCLESARPKMSLGCRFHRALSTAITNLFIFFWSLAFLWGILILLKYYWRKREEEEQAMYEMVQKIITAVQNHYKEWEQNLERYPYVGILHIRDTLIPPQERKKMKRVWDRAVDFLASNESRIQTESHRVAGEDMLVWRWTRTSYLSDSER